MVGGTVASDERPAASSICLVTLRDVGPTGYGMCAAIVAACAIIAGHHCRGDSFLCELAIKDNYWTSYQREEEKCT
eukprot:scaffold114580_cov45-Attheya_sp.AAC.1